ncbi:MAG TPA: SagB/ThcOx family dehydrogenase [Vicinamibacteria bacterium]
MPRVTGREAVLRYHARTMHHPGRYAAGPGHLDWDAQPDPFRSYAGAPRVELPLAGDDLVASWGDLHRPGAVGARPLDPTSLGAFLELALGLTAWKEHRGARWALRANPSSGNLHPTEGYVLLAESEFLPAGLFHYLSRDHALEQRWSPTAAGAEAIARRLPPGAFLLGLASIHWRESWKYGERAFRYCQHDAGHALGSLRYAAGVLGWSARLLDAPGDDDARAFLGLDRDGDFAALAPPDREHPDGLLVVAQADAVDEAADRVERDLDDLRAAVREGTWAGVPNPLSPTHVDWSAVGDVAAATAKPRTVVSRSSVPAGVPDDRPSPGLSMTAHPTRTEGDELSAVRLLRQRRSAVAMDGTTGLGRSAFFHVVERLLPRPGIPPWDVLPGPSRVHPVFLVHRVDGLAPGLYLLERAPGALEDLRKAMRRPFVLEVVEGRSLPLFLLEEGDARSVARFASCHQEIASDSAFAVAMLADLDGLDREPWLYRRAHWEAGVVGQVLYLEAEAAGVRGTGIGCYFDDVVHEALGLADDRFRDLYHFTVGGAVEDRRLTTRPGYGDAVGKRGRPGSPDRHAGGPGAGGQLGVLPIRPLDGGRRPRIRYDRSWPDDSTSGITAGSWTRTATSTPSCRGGRGGSRSA